MFKSSSVYTNMTSTTLFVKNTAPLSLGAAELASLFGHFVDVVRISVKERYAFVDVPSYDQALYVLEQLHGRFVKGAYLPPLQVELAKNPTQNLLVPQRVQTPHRRLDDPIWQFAVDNIAPGLEFDQVLKLFRQVGTVIRWFHESCKFGRVILRTTHHWSFVVSLLNGTTLAGQELAVSFDAMDDTHFLNSIGWHEEDADVKEFYIGNLVPDGDSYSDVVRAAIQDHCRPWSEVLRLHVVPWQRYGFLRLNCPLSVDEIIRRMNCLVVHGRPVVAAVAHNTVFYFEGMTLVIVGLKPV